MAADDGHVRCATRPLLALLTIRRLIHQQYRESPTFYDIAGRLAGAAPFLVLLVYQSALAMTGAFERSC